jgi:hypothetical protein
MRRGTSGRDQQISSRPQRVQMRTTRSVSWCVCKCLSQMCLSQDGIAEVVMIPSSNAGRGVNGVSERDGLQILYGFNGI